jgi:hypothetical protein
MWRCRVQERDDLAGAKRLYGGTWRARPNIFCLKNPPSGAVKGLVATAGSSEEEIAKLSWSASARAKQYAIQRSAVGGTCPTKYNPSAVIGLTSALSYADVASYYKPLAIGSYCYAVWSLNRDGYANPYSRAVVRHVYSLPPVPAPVEATISLANKDVYGWEINIALTPAEGRVVATRSIGACQGAPENATLTSYGYPIYDYIPIEDVYTSGTTICYRFWSVQDGALGLRYSDPLERAFVLT